MTRPIDLIIDCDPGIDDALALWLAAARPDRFHLLAVTTVAGNRPASVTCDNAIRLLDAAGLRQVPVYRGAGEPLSGQPARCNLVHGVDGLGGVQLPLQRSARPKAAWQYLLRALNNHPPQSLTLAAIGPLTNLALAEAHQPGVLSRLKQLVIMGGAVTCAGNVTPKAEFNFHADPDAAQRVLHAGVSSLTLFGLDVTGQVAMDAAWLDSLQQLPGHCAAVARAMLRTYASVDPLLHDACPIAALLAPDLFHGSPWQLQVETLPGDAAGQVSGQRVDGQALRPGTVQVPMAVQTAGVLRLVRDALERLP